LAVKTTDEKTATQFLYLRKPTGVFYARLYTGGKSKWISLKTKTRSVAKIKLADLLKKHHENRDARRNVEEGSATVGKLSRDLTHHRRPLAHFAALQLTLT
jgi:hypothetical protein